MSCKWLTVKEAAQAFRVDGVTIRRWVTKGYLKAIVIERTIRICAEPLTEHQPLYITTKESEKGESY